VVSVALESHNPDVTTTGSTTCTSPVAEIAIVVFWLSAGNWRRRVVSLSGAMTASVTSVYVYVPGEYANVQDPLRGTLLNGTGAVGGPGCAGWAGNVFGASAGTGAEAGGEAAHAITRTTLSIAAAGFSFILESWRERCHRPISRVLYANLSIDVTVISLDAQSPTRSSSLPATSLSGWTPFAAYLALLPLGFAEPHVLPHVR
jgi:hypothetical protein